MKGTILKQKFLDHYDIKTKRRIRQLTSEPGNHHHLYFTSNSFIADDEHVLLISDSTNGHPNIFSLSLIDGEMIQLTSNNEGYLKSYVYYDGNHYKGLGKASPSYNPNTDTLLYIQGNEVRLLEVKTLDEKTIYKLPEGVMTGFTHLSHDGRYACIPYISAKAFDVGEGNQFHLIRDKVYKEQLESHVLVIDTKTNKGEVWFSQVGWITHVQFHPKNNSEILYNHEGGDVDQRIWLYRDGEITKVRDQSSESGSIWICHEMWLRDGNGILYHGTKKSGSFVGLAELNKRIDVEISFPSNMISYGHFTSSSKDDQLVTDGVIDSKMLHLCRCNWEEKKLSWEPLCYHGSSFQTQDVHPHPIFSHSDRYILFTSDIHNEATKGNVYLIDLKGYEKVL
jgi:oligogalacturonide lyase